MAALQDYKNTARTLLRRAPPLQPAIPLLDDPLRRRGCARACAEELVEKEEEDHASDDTQLSPRVALAALHRPSEPRRGVGQGRLELVKRVALEKRC